MALAKLWALSGRCSVFWRAVFTAKRSSIGTDQNALRSLRNDSGIRPGMISRSIQEILGVGTPPANASADRKKRIILLLSLKPFGFNSEGLFI